jgi:transcriptional regulator with XRE-family HTH domain
MPAAHPDGKRALEYIKDVMRSKNLKASQIGKILGISHQSIASYIEGKTNPSLLFAKKVNSAFPDFEIENEIYPRIQRPLPVLESTPNGRTIPFIDTDVYGSFLPSLSDVITLKPSTFISIPFFSSGEGAVQVTGHSMKGYINHGDWVVIKRITNRHSIMHGEPHLIVTRSDNMKTVKFIKPDPDDEDRIMLIPYNIEQFEPQSISKEDVLDIYRVLGLFKTV